MQNTADTRSEQADPVVIPLPNGAEQNDVEQNKPVLDLATEALLPDPGPRADETILDDFEALERATTLDGDEDDEPGGKEEIAVIPVVSNLPKFARFRVNPDTIFDMWGTTDEAGMDRTVIGVTKEFAP